MPVASAVPPLETAYHLMEAPDVVVASSVTALVPQPKLSFFDTTDGASHKVVKFVTADQALVSPAVQTILT